MKDKEEMERRNGFIALVFIRTKRDCMIHRGRAVVTAGPLLSLVTGNLT
jgi:hypothetical protein